MVRAVDILGSVASFLLLNSANASMLVKETKYEQWTQRFQQGFLGRKFDSVRESPQVCLNGEVTVAREKYNCSNVDFLSFISLQEMEITQNPHQGVGIAAADVWGWLSPTNKEFTLFCMDNGISVVDTTDPVNPCVVGLLPSNRRADPWCDIKVYKDTAYITKDSRGGDFVNDTNIGGQVLDLLPLDELDCKIGEPALLTATSEWNFHGSSHNLAINTETGFLYSVGSDYCLGGLIVADLKKDRLHPEYVSCIDGDGYTHDAQCVIYDGPDQRFVGREICFAFNEDTLTIWDVENKSQPIRLSRLLYPGHVYSHQGWLNDDMTYILLDDELNEWCSSPAPLNQSASCLRFAADGVDGIVNTSTVLVNVKSLTDAIYEGKYIHSDVSIDHNLYVWSLIHRKGYGGNGPLDSIPDPSLAYLNNYLAGLRILNISSNDVSKFQEVGFFDVTPNETGIVFAGAWSGYLHPSGAYAISSIERGLYMLKPNFAFVVNPDTITPAPAGSDDGPSSDIVAALVMVALIAVLVLIGCVPGFLKTREELQEETSSSEKKEQVVAKASV